MGQGDAMTGCACAPRVSGVPRSTDTSRSSSRVTGNIIEELKDELKDEQSNARGFQL